MSRPTLLALVLLTGCLGSGTVPRPQRLPFGGDPDRGEQVVEYRNCGRCHTIPGVRGAFGVVGPPLTKFAFRSFIAGEVPNTPENLIRWVRNPQEIEPRTAMPNLGLDDREARDVAAFLYTLR